MSAFKKPSGGHTPIASHEGPLFGPLSSALDSAFSSLIRAYNRSFSGLHSASGPPRRFHRRLSEGLSFNVRVPMMATENVERGELFEGDYDRVVILERIP